MRRGDVVVVATGGGFGGKPRPALVLQADAFDLLPTVVLALFSSTLTDATPVRPRVLPDAHNGLREVSDLMADIIITARREDIGQLIGRLSPPDLARAERAVLMLLGFGG